MTEEKKYDLEERLLDYATDILGFVNGMSNDMASRHVAQQLLRSGTSPMSNHGEAQSAESARDFIHKMTICLKELKEAHRWLRLIQKANLRVTESELERLIDEPLQLIRIFKASIRTAKSNSMVREESPAWSDNRLQELYVRR